MRSSLSHQGSADWSPARAAWFAGPLIDQMLMLEAALPSFRIDVVGDGGPLSRDGFGKHFLDSGVQLAGARLAERS